MYILSLTVGNGKYRLDFHVNFRDRFLLTWHAWYTIRTISLAQFPFYPNLQGIDAGFPI